MPIRLAIIGLDLVQRPWLDALRELRTSGEIEIVALGHRTVAQCRDVAEYLAQQTFPAFDDLRLLLKQTTPQVLLMDRPSNASLDFLRLCIAQGVAIFSLGPPVESLAEAKAVSEMLPAQTHLLQTWPRFSDAPACRHCAQAEDFLRPIRFASASWLGLNHALAKTLPAGAPTTDLPVRSLSVLAWDLLATLLPLMGMPTSVYAAIRGTVPAGNAFIDLSGAAAVTLRFPDDAAASLTLCDRVLAATAPGPPGPFSRRDLLLWGGGSSGGGGKGMGGTLRLSTDAYEFRDDSGAIIDASPNSPPPSAMPMPVDSLREFLRHVALPPSPHRGWSHHLEEIAAILEALVVSHRTGQPESPDRLRTLRR